MQQLERLARCNAQASQAGIHSEHLRTSSMFAAMFVQGLPATVTSLLSLSALRLRDRQVLIKRTDIIENLGVATIIASDKTGTLTQNRMTVENLWCNLVSTVGCGRGGGCLAVGDLGQRQCSQAA